MAATTGAPAGDAYAVKCAPWSGGSAKINIYASTYRSAQQSLNQ
jgi:hypothetical protein